MDLELGEERRWGGGGTMAVYTIKFMFADATTVSETFDTGSNIHDAKLKIIAAWPAGPGPPALRPALASPLPPPGTMQQPCPAALPNA